MNLPYLSNEQQEPVDSASTNNAARATRQEPTLLHVLAEEPPANGRIRVRATVRTGSPKIGDRLWFEEVDRERRALIILSMEDSPRWCTIEFRGLEADLDRIATGTYLHGETS